jgi:hypothetical protein
MNSTFSRGFFFAFAGFFFALEKSVMACMDASWPAEPAAAAGPSAGISRSAAVAAMAKKRMIVLPRWFRIAFG